MKLGCLVLAVFFLAAVNASDELCGLSDELKERAVKCITAQVSDQMKSKWETLKQTFGNSDLEAAKKLCELKKGAQEAGSKADFFTESEETEIKKAFGSCKAENVSLVSPTEKPAAKLTEKPAEMPVEPKV